MYTLPKFPRSLNWTELPDTVLGLNTTAGIIDETRQFVHEIN